MGLIVACTAAGGPLIRKFIGIRAQTRAFHQLRQVGEVAEIFKSDGSIVLGIGQQVRIQAVCYLPVVVNNDHVADRLSCSRVKKRLIRLVDEILHVLARGDPAYAQSYSGNDGLFLELTELLVFVLRPKIQIKLDAQCSDQQN